MRQPTRCRFWEREVFRCGKLLLRQVITPRFSGLRRAMVDHADRNVTKPDTRWPCKRRFLIGFKCFPANHSLYYLGSQKMGAFY